MMQRSWHDITLALAGVFQATKLVKDIAFHGNANPYAFEVCIRSIFETNPSSTLAVYGSADDLAMGLRIVIDYFDKHSKKRDLELTKIIISVMHLERKLMKQPKMLEMIAAGIEKARAQSEHFSIVHENVIANLADLYETTISTLNPRIMINGEREYLSHPDNVNKIRALLLAALRSAVLWDQRGGGRWQLIFNRNQIIREAKRLLVV